VSSSSSSALRLTLPAVPLSECRLVVGQATRVFVERSSDDIRLLQLSLSLIYDDSRAPSSPATPVRSLDMVCKTRQEFRIWREALSYLVDGPPPPALLAEFHNTRTMRANAQGDILQLRQEWEEAMGGFSGSGPGTVRVGLRLTRPPASLLTALPSPALIATWSPAFEQAQTRSDDIRSQITDSQRLSGDVWALGANGWGQLGLGDDLPRAALCVLPQLLGRSVRTMACGIEHTMALTGEHSQSGIPCRSQTLWLADTGELFAWGSGTCGALGNGGHGAELTPQLLRHPGRASLPFRFVRVACGASHTVAITPEGVPFSFGDNSCGQLLHGDTAARLVPCPIVAFRLQAVDVACGAHQTAILEGELLPAARILPCVKRVVQWVGGCTWGGATTATRSAWESQLPRTVSAQSSALVRRWRWETPSPFLAESLALDLTRTSRCLASSLLARQWSALRAETLTWLPSLPRRRLRGGGTASGSAASGTLTTCPPPRESACSTPEMEDSGACKLPAEPPTLFSPSRLRGARPTQWRLV
jgi:hypothetical protein